MKMFDLQKSPIRQNINSLKENQLSVFEDGNFEREGEHLHYVGIQVRTILKDIENMMGTMQNHANDTIRIAVMGEVKAGKSTFINTLAGKKVAYTDILEATAIVSEITFAEEEYVHLLDAKGQIVKDFSMEEMLEWMEEMVDEEADFSEYEKMDIGITAESLKEVILVDTPGLLSITSQNHDITNKYVAETDYIIWVINSHNLGSKAVNDYIDKIKLSGKPMIGIINKVDSMEEQKEIEEYIFKEYGAIFEDIFFVSSKKAWDLLQLGEEDWKEQTGFEGILDCIEELAEDKEHSTTQTQYYQLQREREVHMKMRERIRKRKEYYDNEIATFSYVNTELKKSIRQEIKRWCKDEFFITEREKLLHASNERFPELFSKYSDSLYLTDIIEKKYNEITSFIYQKWNIVMESLSITSSQVTVDFTYDKTITLEQEKVENSLSDVDFDKKIKSVLVKGIAFAGYWAWLGPAAEVATFVGSLIPCTMPFVIAGTVFDVVKKNSADTRAVMENTKKKQEAVEDLYKEVLKLMLKESDKMEKELFACTDHYYKDKCEEYKEKTKQFHFDFTDIAFSKFMAALDTYITKLDAAIGTLGEDKLPEPPKASDLE